MNGKGCKRRPTDEKRYGENWERALGNNKFERMEKELSGSEKKLYKENWERIFGKESCNDEVQACRGNKDRKRDDDGGLRVTHSSRRDNKDA